MDTHIDRPHPAHIPQLGSSVRPWSNARPTVFSWPIAQTKCALASHATQSTPAHERCHSLDRLQFFRVADACCKLQGRAPRTRPPPLKTPFGSHAAETGRALHAIEGRTGKLAKLACESSLFDDPAAEIGEISVTVREELAVVAAGLEALAAMRRSGGRQQGTHVDSVVQWLRVRVTALTDAFQAALKQREATISVKESRAAKLSGISSLASPFGSTRGAAAGGGGPQAPPPRAAAPATCIPPSSSHGDGDSPFSVSGCTGRAVQRSQLVQRRRPTAGVDGGMGGGMGAPVEAAPRSNDWHSMAAVGVPAHHDHRRHHPANNAFATRHVHHDMGACGFGMSPEGGSQGRRDGRLSTPRALEHDQQFWTPRSQRNREQEVSQMHSTLAEIGEMFRA